MRLGALTVSQKGKFILKFGNWLLNTQLVFILIKARVIRLVVGSENKAKLSAVQKACSRMFSHLKRQQQLKSNHNRNTHADTDEDEDEDDNVKLEIHGFAVPSGVSDQPMSDLETMTGAKNRAKATLEAARAMNLIPEEEEEDASISVFSIGIEGGIEKVGDHYFECGWVA